MMVYAVVRACDESGERTMLFRSFTASKQKAEERALRLDQKYGPHHYFFVVEDEVGDDFELPDEHSDDEVMSWYR